MTFFPEKNTYLCTTMAEQDDLLSNLRKTLSEQRIESFHILEELVPLEEQMEYFRYFERLRHKNEPFVRDEEIAPAQDLTAFQLM